MSYKKLEARLEKHEETMRLQFETLLCEYISAYNAWQATRSPGEYDEPSEEWSKMTSAKHHLYQWAVRRVPPDLWKLAEGGEVESQDR